MVQLQSWQGCVCNLGWHLNIFFCSLYPALHPFPPALTPCRGTETPGVLDHISMSIISYIFGAQVLEPFVKLQFRLVLISRWWSHSRASASNTGPYRAAAPRVVSITGPYTGCWRPGRIYYLLYLLEAPVLLGLPYRGALTLQPHPRTHSHKQPTVT